MLSFGKRTIFVRCQCSVMTTALWSVCRNVYARIVAKLRCAGFGRYYSGFGRCAGIVPAARFASSGFRKACSVNRIGGASSRAAVQTHLTTGLAGVVPAAHFASFGFVERVFRERHRKQYRFSDARGTSAD